MLGTPGNDMHRNVHDSWCGTNEDMVVVPGQQGLRQHY